MGYVDDLIWLRSPKNKPVPVSKEMYALYVEGNYSAISYVEDLMKKLDEEFLREN